ncbi:MAG: (Na+)-NQR maturation NqrM [Leptospiraceae bacterium]|nr:(Na+)-NQR maturation NqrM [Leptospiraceae bacterium]
MLPVILIAMLIVGVAFTIMAVGVIFQNKPIHGSCGGLKKIASLGGGVEMSCEFCERGEENPNCEYKQPATGAQ